MRYMLSAIVTVLQLSSCALAEPPVVSLDEYSQLYTGMSYSQAVSIIGDAGVEQSQNEIPGVPGVMPRTITIMYAWQNADGSNMNAIFQNDALVQKAQFGLQ